MGYDISYEGVVRIDPPLGDDERALLNTAAAQRHHLPGDVNALVPGLAGYWMPWTATARGHLAPPNHPNRTGMLAEWLRWLAVHLTGEVAHPLLSGIAGDHDLRGTVTGTGRAPGDQFRIVVDGANVWVERDRMPCPACWLNCQTMVPPSAAHAFEHPEPDGNLDVGALDAGLHEELLSRYETVCFEAGFVPTRRRVEVQWPPPPGAPPPGPAVPAQGRRTAGRVRHAATGDARTH